MPHSWGTKIKIDCFNLCLFVYVQCKACARKSFRMHSTLRPFNTCVTLSLYLIPQAWRIFPLHSSAPCWQLKNHPPSGFCLNCVLERNDKTHRLASCRRNGFSMQNKTTRFLSLLISPHSTYIRLSERDEPQVDEGRQSGPLGCQLIEKEFAAVRAQRLVINVQLDTVSRCGLLIKGTHLSTMSLAKS